MKKAQGFIEIALMLCVIVVVTVCVMTIFNNQKTKLANMSKITLKSETTQK